MSLRFDNGTVRLYQGNARDMVFLDNESVDCVVTSPPYWGLRDYGLEPVVWDGDEGCEHVWEEFVQPAAEGTRTLYGNSALRAGHQGEASATMKPKVSAFCTLCGAWRGTLGLEPTPQLYVQHLVQVFQEVWRVLKPWGNVWLNLGDSYAGSGGAHTFDHANPGISKSAHRNGFAGYVANEGRGRHKNNTGLKPKDLVGIPWRVAFALQEDGWWLRSDIIWAKPNPMPESVTDRPTRSHEYLFLLTKAERYYYDQEAVREPAQDWGDRDRSQGSRRSQGYLDAHGDVQRGATNGNFAQRGRNRRSVWWIATQPMGWEYCGCGAVYDGASYKRLRGGSNPTCSAEVEGEQECGGTAWEHVERQFVCLGCGCVYTKGQHKKLPKAAVCARCDCDDLWGSHFATFPEKLVEPCILAGTSEKGNCPECGKPWERVVEKEQWTTRPNSGGKRGGIPNQRAYIGQPQRGTRFMAANTTGWRPTCDHDVEPAPAIVLDPFAGSGTVGIVAQRFGRHAVLVEPSGAYCALAAKRVTQEPFPLLQTSTV